MHVGWKARLSEQLGFYSPLELSEPHATRLLDDPIALAGLSSAVTLIRTATPERQAYPQLFDAMIVLIEAMPHTDVWPALYTRFELGLLAAMGYGLDLTRCAVTGETEGLAWVSPRTGSFPSPERRRPEGFGGRASWSWGEGSCRGCRCRRGPSRAGAAALPTISLQA